MPFREGGGAAGRSGKGRSSQGKMLLAGAVELSGDREPRRVWLDESDNFGAGSLRGFIATVVEPGAQVITDGWSGYHTLPGNPHEARVIGDRKAHEVLEWTHRVFSNLKRWAMGVCRGLRRKHFQRYLDEFVLRWNPRRHRATSFDSLLGIGLGLKPATYRDIVERRTWRAGSHARTPSPLVTITPTSWDPEPFLWSGQCHSAVGAVGVHTGSAETGDRPRHSVLGAVTKML